MTDNNSAKPYDLEERTFLFAQSVRAFIKSLPRTIGNQEDARQVIRSSGSVGANYIEANESLSKRDFQMRIKISRKEAKESRFWLRLLDTLEDENLNADRQRLIQESTELLKIFSSMLRRET